MLYITRNTTSILTVTVSEKQTLTSPYWLWELKYRGDNSFKYFIAPDSSSFPSRYNLFTVTESSIESLTSGVVYLPNEGEYEYRIYEQSSSTNLNPVNATTLCEIGMLTVISTQSAPVSYQPNPTISVYNPT